MIARFSVAPLWMAASLLLPTLLAQERTLPVDLPAPATLPADAFVLVHNGESRLYRRGAASQGEPFLSGIYKGFGFSPGNRRFAYLKANGKFPTFDLYTVDLEMGAESRVTDAAVHHAAWSPAGQALAYIWLDAASRFHLSIYDLSSRTHREIAAGQLMADFLEWSPDGGDLLYIEMSALSSRAVEDGRFGRTLHRHSLRQRADSVVSAAQWGQFSAGELIVAGGRATLRQRSVPNPRSEEIQRFAIVGGETFAEISENGRPAVKRWNAGSGAYDAVKRGRIHARTAAGIIVQEFTRGGVQYDYVSAEGVRTLAVAALAAGWKIPFAGVASVVQGGALYTDGSCDGAMCLVTAHTGALGYAIDWQQRPENGDGNSHVLATGDGTVAAIVNNVTCNSATPSCSIGWDNYMSPCLSSGGAGNYVTVAHLDGSYSLYAHLKSGSVQVVPGENVLQGAYLADQGHSGGAGAYNNYLGCGDHLHFSRQIGPGIWDQSMPTDFVETPCVMGCPAPYTSANVELAPISAIVSATPSSWTPGGTVTVSLSGRNFIYGSSVAASGTGVTVDGVTVLSPTRIAATLSIAAGTPPGSVNLTVNSANGSSNPMAFQIVAPAAGGALSGSASTPSGPQNLTALGASDWAHWGLSTTLSFNHKASAAPQIGDFTLVGAEMPTGSTNAGVAHQWSDGAPTVAAAGVTAGVSITGQNNGFRITAPADSLTRTLVVYVSVSGAQGRFHAELSDGSAPAFLDTSLTSASGVVPAAYTLTYRAASPGQTLVVTFTQLSSSGTVTLQAATLGGASAAPEFAVSATAPVLAMLPGNSNSFGVNVSALSGFAAAVDLAVTGLPAGVAASPSPATLTGGGISTIVLTADPTAAPGSYPLAVVGTSGGVTRSAAVTLVVNDFAVAASPSSRTVMAGGSVTYTITAAAPAGTPGSISLSVSGLPAGVSASFNSAALAPGASATLTIAAAPGTPAGTHSITIIGNSGTASRTGTIVLTVAAAAAGGGLSGSRSAASGTVQLTTEGAYDWAHWGLTSATSVNRKASVAQQIGDLTVLGGAANRYTNSPVGFTWSDGTQSISATNSTTGIYTIGLGRGFALTAPADTTVRTLKVYVGAFLTQGEMIARLSDGSAPDYADTLINTAAPATAALYTFVYRAASAGQTLTLTFRNTTATPNGNIAIQAASLAGGPDFAVAAAPSSQSVVPGGSTSYTASVSALNGFTGAVSLSVSGLPAGATGSFSPATLPGGGQSTLTVATAGAVAVGSYPVTIAGTSGSVVRTATATLVVTQPASGGSLSGTLATPSGTAQLTAEGPYDWAHWGYATATDYNRKAAVTPQISNFTLAAAGTPTRYANNAVGFTWTDGTPTASATGSTTGVFVSGQNNGFRITATADTNIRTLRVYVGAWRAQGRMVAQLSDGSAPDYLDTSLSNSAGVTTLGVYTFTYKAASGGQTLTITYTQNTATAGNVTLQAAALAGAGTPDFTVGSTPVSQSAIAGGFTTYTVSVGALSGFDSSVALSAGGLPAGVTAAFSPATVSGAGASTLTLTISAAVATGTYPFTITGTSGSLTRTANATLVVTDSSVSATPASQTIAASGSAAYTISAGALNGFSGSVAWSVSGLPSGVTASFNPPSVTGSGSSTMTLTVSTASPIGSYPLTVTGTSGAAARTVPVALGVTAAPAGGTLSGSGAAPAGPVDLTGAGTSDWAHWGYATAGDFNHKTGVTQQISNFTVVGSGAPARYANNAVGFTWTDGTPTASATATTTGVFIAGQGQGFRITAPADTTPRTLRVYVGAWRAQGRFVAQLSDNSAPDYSDGSLINSGGVTTLRVYTLNYAAASAGQTLTVTFTQQAPTVAGITGNVTIQAASLAGGPSTPDFGISAAPASRTALVGTGASYTVNVASLNGFSGAVTFSATGLPAGATADFTPATVNGSGSTTMTVTTVAGTAPGVYPLTITATGGVLSRTASASLAVSDFSVSATPASRSVAPGNAVTYTTTVASLGGFTGDVALSVAGLPPDVTASFSPATVAGGAGSSTLTLTAAAGASPATYPLTITGSSGSVTHTANVSVTVALTPDFSVAASPSNRTAVPGGAASYTVDVAAQNGFAGDVNLSVAGMPAGVTANFSPATVTGGSGSSAMTLSIGSGVASGSYTLTITALSGALSHTATVSLAVADFAVSVTPGSQAAVVGSPASYTVTVSAQNGFAGGIGLGVSGLPSGVTVAFTPANVTGSGSSTMALSIPAGTAPGTYQLTITGASGGLTRSASATLQLTDFTVGGTPSSRSAMAGNATSYTVDVSAVNGFSGSVGFSISGLPAGVTATFNPSTVNGSGSSTLALTIAGGAATGTYPLTITATSGAVAHTAGVSLTITAPPTGGTLIGSGATPAATVQLTMEGTSDWTHWGLSTAADVNRKAGVAQQIGNLVIVGSGTPARYSNNATGFTWTDGAPTVTATATTTGLFVVGQGQGFQITAPADTTPRTLRVYVGAWRAQARLTAHLSDNSAVDYSDATLSNAGGITTLKVYTLTYAAVSAGQTLTVTLIQESPTVSGITGNVTIQAATLAGGNVSPDFAVSVSPAAQSAPVGGAAQYTVSIAGVNGFNGSVSLSAGGLPTGVSAAFNPPVVTGSGTSTMTLTSSASAAAGNYGVTVTGVSSGVTRTAPATLTLSVAGSLTGSVAAPAGPVQLTTEGALDWAHWGLATATDFNRKAGVTPQITNFTSVAGGAPARYANNAVGFTWSDGAPAATATNTTTGVYIAGVGQGFRITVPADTTSRTLRLYVGAWRTQGRLVAHLSDGSAADYVDTSVVNSAGVTTLGVYTLTYRAGIAGQTLTVAFTQNTATYGNVTLQAATLQ